MKLGYRDMSINPVGIWMPILLVFISFPLLYGMFVFSFWLIFPVIPLFFITTAIIVVYSELYLRGCAWLLYTDSSVLVKQTTKNQRDEGERIRAWMNKSDIRDADVIFSQKISNNKNFWKRNTLSQMDFPNGWVFNKSDTDIHFKYTEHMIRFKIVFCDEFEIHENPQ